MQFIRKKNNNISVVFTTSGKYQGDVLFHRSR